MAFSFFPLQNNAWQAFEPPLDLTQEVDICENSHLENALNDDLFLGERNVFSCPSTSASGSLRFSKFNEAFSGEGSSAMCKSLKGADANEVFRVYITLLTL